MAIKTYICEHCQQSFQKATYPSSPKFRYCSRKCQGEAKSLEGKVDTDCEQCGTTFKVEKSFAKTRKYCSRQCSADAKKAKAYRVKNCKFCGEEFQVTKTKKHAQEFCSTKCRSQQKSKDNTVTTNCLNCDKEFTHIKSRPKKFCSFDCSNNYNSEQSKVDLICNGCGCAFSRRKGLIQDNLNGVFCSNSCWHSNRPITTKHRRTEEGKLITADGYVKICENGKHILEHRSVMQKHLGRDLLKEENVHHLNGQRDDNNLHNLELWSTRQPNGQRVTDKLDWCLDMLETYKETHPEYIQGLKDRLF